MSAVKADPALVKQVGEQIARLIEAGGRAARAAVNEPAEVIAERGKRKMLVVAEQALDNAKTTQEQTTAVAAMAAALKANGFDRERPTGPQSVQVVVQEADVPEDVAPDEDDAAPAAATH